AVQRSVLLERIRIDLDLSCLADVHAANAVEGDSRLENEGGTGWGHLPNGLPRLHDLTGASHEEARDLAVGWGQDHAGVQSALGFRSRSLRLGQPGSRLRHLGRLRL